MERENVKVRSGKEYDHLFPRAMLTTIVKKQNATVSDTIRFIPRVINETLFHTAKIARVLKRDSTYETCRAIWEFVYQHIAYRRDEKGKEQVRSPARAWHDRHNSQGIDCDCMTVFIASILSNLKIRRIALRITKYKEDYFQHIYPVVVLPDGKEIVIDCVTYRFDYEVPYSEKKDTYMDLEYLNGVSGPGTDAEDLLGLYGDEEVGLAELGKLFKKKGGGGSKGGGLKKLGQKIKGAVKKGLHFTNKLNPATVLLRAGILASAKLNLMKIGQRLKYSYLSEDEARKRGVDMSRFSKLKSIREKLEKIFYGAGGKPENLKKAILTGKGNKNHDVSGLGYLYEPMDGMDENTPLSTLLGLEMYGSEMEEVHGLGSLGEPATAASVAAATGVIGSIAALLKKIGNIFPKKSAASSDFEEGGAESAPSVQTSEGSGESASEPAPPADNSPATINDNLPAETNQQSMKASKVEAPANTESGDDGGSSNAEKPTTSPPKPGFWQANKKWLIPSIGVGVIVLSYAGYRMATSKKQSPAPGLSGFPRSKKKKRKKSGSRKPIRSRRKIRAVSLL